MTFHDTYSNWKLYSHLPNDTNWNIESYNCLVEFDTIEKLVSYSEYLPNFIIRNCMLFLMRDDILPIWEDENNKYGGCISYKIYNENVPNFWRELSYYMVSENLILLDDVFINGISISPKKHFCIIKIWIKNINIPKTKLFNHIHFLKSKKHIFKKHIN